MTTPRLELEALYRKYFVEIRKFQFPLTLSMENALDFVEWVLRKENR